MQRVNAGTFSPPFRPGEYSIGLGYPPGDVNIFRRGMPPFPESAPNAFEGHLVALIEDGESDVLVDLSLDQASRPNHTMPLESACFMLPRKWRNEHFVITMPHAIIHYNAIENDVYLTSKDWNDPARARTRNITANVISLIDKKLT